MCPIPTLLFILTDRGLLSDETVGAYKWLLEEFKNAFGKDLNVVITDQDPSMKIAISVNAPPNTRNIAFVFGISLQNLVTKGTAISNKIDFKRRICDIVKVGSPAIPCIDELMTGLQRTNFYSESENHFFGKWTSPHLTLVEFLSHYDTAIEYQRYIERKNDHDSRYKNPKLKTDLQMEKEAIVQVDNAEKYSIRDMQAENRIRGDNNFVVYQRRNGGGAPAAQKISLTCSYYVVATPYPTLTLALRRSRNMDWKPVHFYKTCYNLRNIIV
ncbi:FAR1 DNA binding domain, zinc finger, SWIM-type, MULE transposase domain containing protein [Tanacetum coccineum]|uniref:FAR1 DNA binding domain, zinc finger, SWIM-type, MULE transposase domain containing protein n=1 Tax=Tanacetum coccineum TaxID=301880 RepID=A0ABQ5H5W4_9ASTR